MNDNESSLAMFDQDKLKPEVRHAAIAALMRSCRAKGSPRRRRSRHMG